MASIDTILQDISRMKRDDGIELMSRCFHWTEFDGDDKRQFLHQEFVYENVMYAVKRGLPWSTVGQVAHVTKHLLPKLKGLKTSEVFRLVKDQLSQIQPHLSTAQHALLLEFIVKTYVPHQRLYQAVLSGETGLKHVRSELAIETPPPPQPLCEGIDTVEWQQQQAQKELLLTQSKKEAEITELKKKTEAQMMEKLQARLHNLPIKDTMSKQEVKELLCSFLHSQGEIIMESLMHVACLTEELLQLKLMQKTQLMDRHVANDPVPVAKKIKKK
ncbi:uncharacterized protein C8orf74 homolog [Xyrauchen texanus]|uniref:uncharacterized protein C8orf74 homolog n=1 Tax=Xyrauchen texanus TaxID=154827 RepID=UPI0022419A47|nr:uncharacterized protein C8orf74 homolog [Xyrauchen texanus]